MSIIPKVYAETQTVVPSDITIIDWGTNQTTDVINVIKNLISGMTPIIVPIFGVMLATTLLVIIIRALR